MEGQSWHRILQTQHHELCHRGRQSGYFHHIHTRLLDHSMCTGQLCASPDGRCFPMKGGRQVPKSLLNLRLVSTDKYEKAGT